MELMVPKRDEVVNLLMWEICKSVRCRKDRPHGNLPAGDHR